MLEIHGKRYGFEFKRSDAPGTTRSMRIALSDLGLHHLYVVYPGSDHYQLDDKITALPIGETVDLISDLTGRVDT